MFQQVNEKFLRCDQLKTHRHSSRENIGGDYWILWANLHNNGKKYDINIANTFIDPMQVIKKIRGELIDL